MCVAGSACRDSTGPVLQVFYLTEIDAKPLPVTFGGIDTEETILSGKLFLLGAGSGRALRVTHTRGFVDVLPVIEGDESERSDFRIDNATITVSAFDGCGSFCPSQGGTYSRSMLTLSLGGTQPVYTYRVRGGS